MGNSAQAAAAAAALVILILAVGMVGRAGMGALEAVAGGAVDWLKIVPVAWRAMGELEALGGVGVAVAPVGQVARPEQGVAGERLGGTAAMGL